MGARLGAAQLVFCPGTTRVGAEQSQREVHWAE